MHVQGFRPAPAQPQRIEQSQVLFIPSYSKQSRNVQWCFDDCLYTLMVSLDVMLVTHNNCTNSGRLCLLAMHTSAYNDEVLANIYRCVQMFNIPYGTPYHQQQSTIPWQTTQTNFGGTNARSQPVYNQCIGTPVAPSSAYTNQVTYVAQPREHNFEGTSSNPKLSHNRPQGPAFDSQPGHGPGQEYYTTQHLPCAGQEHTQPRARNQSTPVEAVEGEVVAAMGQVIYGQRREIHQARLTAGGCAESNTIRGPECARQSTTTVGRPVVRQSASAHTSSQGGTRRDHRQSKKEHSPVLNSISSPTLLSTTSSKSSPLSTMSQRKQHRVEEKSYLKEVKRSIAEGRVPQVRLQQNNNGAIVQYKAQFLNALKLAALAIVPNADIDIKNPCTMQEIMQEVKRQFIIEKPLPEGMVEGYLQRLYKRNRAIYHRHWLLHDDNSKPDDCASAAWLQLVDYWKSLEGSRECERNKANASTKKGVSVRYRFLSFGCGNLALLLCATSHWCGFCNSLQFNIAVHVCVIVGEAQKCMQR